MTMLKDSAYDIFVMIPQNAGQYIDDEMIDAWHNIGFKTDLRSISAGCHYCAVKSDDLIEKISSEDMAFSGSICGGMVPYEFLIDTTYMALSRHKYSMVLDGTECGNRNEGINIVVYDRDFKVIVEKVNINTAAKEKTITRY